MKKVVGCVCWEGEKFGRRVAEGKRIVEKGKRGDGSRGREGGGRE